MLAKLNMFWFRRDLRLDDNHALYRALSSSNNVLPIFIFDTEILDKLEDKSDLRLQFIYESIKKLRRELALIGKDIKVFYGKPIDVWKQILKEYSVEQVFANKDYESYSKKRDAEVKSLLASQSIVFNTFKDHVVFEEQEILTQANSPYTVFTPYSRKWKQKLTQQPIVNYPSQELLHHLIDANFDENLTGLNFDLNHNDIVFPNRNLSNDILNNYHLQRDFPSTEGTSKLGVHLRFGTISIRKLVTQAQVNKNQTYLNELIWRDFYAMILDNFPRVEQNAFKPKYDRIEWLNNIDDFEKWCDGKTGYPIVDAGMRQLNQTGYMHNRVRMVVASFLVKHLLIDWRWGEAYFASKLLDFELASNNGGWQWAAGSGCDAAPYFRVFNPTTQQQKFDKNFEYIKKWIPEFSTDAYPKPMVEHKFARERALRTYKLALT